MAGALVFLVLGQPDRMRRRAMEGVAIGQSGEEATEVIGRAPAVCPATELRHLAGSFPNGWSPAAIDVAIERLEAVTAERWVYPLESDSAASCDDVAERTEVGIGDDGSILWFVAVLGSSPLTLPPTLTPAGIDSGAVN